MKANHHPPQYGTKAEELEEKGCIEKVLLKDWKSKWSERITLYGTPTIGTSSSIGYYNKIVLNNDTLIIQQ